MPTNVGETKEAEVCQPLQTRYRCSSANAFSIALLVNARINALIAWFCVSRGSSQVMRVNGISWL